MDEGVARGSRMGAVMRQFIAGVIFGVIVSFGVCAGTVEFGWTDTAKLERVAKACEEILKELREIRAEAKQR